MRRTIAAGFLACVLALGGCAGAGDAPEAGAEAAQEEQRDAQDARDGTAHGAGTEDAESGASPQQDAAAVEDRLDPLVLVNKTHALPEGWEERLELVEEGNSKGEVVAVDKMAYEAFKGLQAEMAAQGIQIELNSGYRSVADQQAIVDQFTIDYGEDYVREFVAEPGHSEHHTGLAFDVFLTIDGYPILTNEEIFAAQDTWDVIHEALHRHGLILRYMDGKEDVTGYTYEPWHYRYVGTEAAGAIWEKGLTLEEYLGELD